MVNQLKFGFNISNRGRINLTGPVWVINVVNKKTLLTSFVDFTIFHVYKVSNLKNLPYWIYQVKP